MVLITAWTVIGSHFKLMSLGFCLTLVVVLELVQTTFGSHVFGMLKRTFYLHDAFLHCWRSRFATISACLLARPAALRARLSACILNLPLCAGTFRGIMLYSSVRRLSSSTTSVKPLQVLIPFIASITVILSVAIVVVGVQPLSVITREKRIP